MPDHAPADGKTVPAARKRRFMIFWWVVGGLLVAVLLLLTVLWWLVVHVPGSSYRGPLPPLTPAQQALASRLRQDVEQLAVVIGERNVLHPAALQAAADYIQGQLQKAGLNVERQQLDVDGVPCHNLIAEIRGGHLAGQIVVVGAHYDSAVGTPGANDNGTGVAALLALARSFAGRHPERTLRLVAFVNEEMPHFKSPAMGSLAYARRCRQRGEQVVGMLSLETIGYYHNEPGTQHYPAPFGMLYPSRGNFIGVIGNLRSRRLVHQVVGTFRDHARFPCEGGAFPTSIPGVSWSDHWAFWQQGYPAVMITDTAPFRYPYYHHPNDTPDKVCFDALARVVEGLHAVIEDLVGQIP